MINHFAEAERALAEADRIANSDSSAYYAADRTALVANKLSEAQVHALLALTTAQSGTR